MNALYLVRHGQDTDNREGLLNGHRDTELTSLGREQASNVATRFVDKTTVDVILSSPLKRTMQTARIIADQLNIGVIEEPLLIERNFGCLTGKPVADIDEWCDDTFKTPHINYFLSGDSIETFDELAERAETFLKKISSEYSNKKILAVTHGDSGQVIEAVYRGWHWQESLASKHFKNTDIIELTNQEGI